MNIIVEKICREIDFGIAAFVIFLSLIGAICGISEYISKCHDDNVKIEMVKSGMEQKIVGDTIIWVKGSSALEAK